MCDSATVEVEQFGIYTARFRPARTDDLKPGCGDVVGRVGRFEALWVIEDGPYEGQYAMWPDWCGDGGARWPFGWVPECDLEIIEKVDDLCRPLESAGNPD